MKNFRLPRLETAKHYCKKTSFADEKTANYYLDKLKKSSRRAKVPVYAYLCTKCFAWHLTSWEQPDVLQMITELNEEIEEYNASMKAEIEAWNTGMDLMADTRNQNRNLLNELHEVKMKNIALEGKLKKLEFLNNYRR